MGPRTNFQRFATRRAGSGDKVYTWYIPGIYLVYPMPELGVRNQCIFLAVYASCLLLCAVNMASQQTGSSVLTQMERFVCCSCEKQGLPAFYVSKRAVHIHQSRSTMCKGGGSKRITVMTRPGDVIAGGSGGMGPCPPPQHQPPGIYLSYTWYMPIKCLIPGIYWVYTNG